MKVIYNDDYHKKYRAFARKNYHEQGGKIKKSISYYRKKLNLTDEDLEEYDTLADKLAYCLKLNFKRKYNL